MASLGELCRDLGALDEVCWASFVAASNKRDALRHGQIVSKQEAARRSVRSAYQHEHERSIFEECKEAGMRRKRVRDHCTPKTGSIILAVRTGEYARCVCKHRM